MVVVSLGFFGLSTYAQTDFKWDVIIDSLDDSKSQLYSKTKFFISETWKSAKDVIQNDDKESGLILIKGLSVQNLFFQLNDHKWTYSHTIKFFMKDNKCRIIIEDVYCQSARCQQYEWPHMPVADNYPSSNGLKITGVNEKRYLELMTSLKQELQSIVDLYSSAMKKSVVADPDW